jgi:hypothetical protein
MFTWLRVEPFAPGPFKTIDPQLPGELPDPGTKVIGKKEFADALSIPLIANEVLPQNLTVAPGKIFKVIPGGTVTLPLMLFISPQVSL